MSGGKFLRSAEENRGGGGSNASARIDLSLLAPAQPFAGAANSGNPPNYLPGVIATNGQADAGHTLLATGPPGRSGGRRRPPSRAADSALTAVGRPAAKSPIRPVNPHESERPESARSSHLAVMTRARVVAPLPSFATGSGRSPAWLDHSERPPTGSVYQYLGPIGSILPILIPTQAPAPGTKRGQFKAKRLLVFSCMSGRLAASSGRIRHDQARCHPTTRRETRFGERCVTSRNSP